jgi:hypothetical protein
MALRGNIWGNILQGLRTGERHGGRLPARERQARQALGLCRHLREGLLESLAAPALNAAEVAAAEQHLHWLNQAIATTAQALSNLPRCQATQAQLLLARTSIT